MYRPNEHERIEADFGKLIAHYLDKRKSRFLSGFSLSNNPEFQVRFGVKIFVFANSGKNKAKQACR